MRNSPDAKIVLLAAMQALMPACGNKVDGLAGVEGAAKEIEDKCGRLIDSAKPGELRLLNDNGFEVSAGWEYCRCYDMADWNEVECVHVVPKEDWRGTDFLRGESAEHIRVNVHGDVVSVMKRDKAGARMQYADALLVGDGPDHQFCADRMSMNIGSAKECRDTNARVKATLKRVLARAKRR